jgi:hypothetical protein
MIYYSRVSAPLRKADATALKRETEATRVRLPRVWGSCCNMLRKSIGTTNHERLGDGDRQGIRGEIGIPQTESDELGDGTTRQSRGSGR